MLYDAIEQIAFLPTLRLLLPPLLPEKRLSTKRRLKDAHINPNYALEKLIAYHLCHNL